MAETKVPDYFVCLRRGWRVFLVDTPGFDDSVVSNSRILQMIATVLEKLFKEKKNIDGLVYLHRIVDNRMGGHASQNVDLFSKLCGREAMKRVVLLTTMWDTINPGVPGFLRQDFEKREEELIAEHWNKLIGNGATPFRSSNTRAAALTVLDHILDVKAQIAAEHVDVTDMGLQIQDELVSEEMPLHCTGAGRVVAVEFEESLARLKGDEAYLEGLIKTPLGDAQRRIVSNDLNNVRKKIKDLEDEQKSFFSWSWFASVVSIVAVGIGYAISLMG
jgi:hypothetical protein